MATKKQNGRQIDQFCMEVYLTTCSQKVKKNGRPKKICTVLYLDNTTDYIMSYHTILYYIIYIFDYLIYRFRATLWPTKQTFGFRFYLNKYFRLHVCLSLRPYVRHTLVQLHYLQLCHKMALSCLLCVKSEKYAYWITPALGSMRGSKAK